MEWNPLLCVECNEPIDPDYVVGSEDYHFCRYCEPNAHFCNKCQDELAR